MNKTERDPTGEAIPAIWERWRHIAEPGRTIECPSMTLIAGDHDPPIVEGSGQVTVTSSGEWRYTLDGAPADHLHAMRSLNRLAADPYDGLLRSRLHAVDADGTHINLGWTEPKALPRDKGELWMFTGECEAITVSADGETVPQTTDLFILPRHHRSRVVLRRFMPDPIASGGVRERRLDFEDSELVFRLFDDADMLTVTATATETLPLTYTENWLAEPLRIMFGQLAYPRIVARSQTTGTMVSIRPTNRWHAGSDAAGLWDRPDGLTNEAGFWSTYEALLRYVARPRAKDGQLNFEPNKVTQLYQEVVQAAHATRWIWALAFASAVEGVTLLLVPRGTPRALSDPAAVNAFCAYVDAWPGTNAQLKNVAKSAAHRTLDTSAVQAIRDMRDAGDVAPDQFKAWDKLRNQVMHGRLISPYSSAEEDKLLLDLAALLHSVTRKLVSAP